MVVRILKAKPGDIRLDEHQMELFKLNPGAASEAGREALRRALIRSRTRRSFGNDRPFGPRAQGPLRAPGIAQAHARPCPSFPCSAPLKSA